MRRCASPRGALIGSRFWNRSRVSCVDARYERANYEENDMGRILASLVVAAALLTLASSEASAWVCRAAGLGSGGWARSYNVVDAKIWALRRCERNSPVPVCTILWCRPG
jgi:hypothetical protein